MRNVLIFITFFSLTFQAKAQKHDLEKISERVQGKQASVTEQSLRITKEKLQLEIENKKLRELLNSSEERIKELILEKKDLEQDLASTEKELSESDKRNILLSDQNDLLNTTLVEIQKLLKKSSLQEKNINLKN